MGCLFVLGGESCLGSGRDGTSKQGGQKAIASAAYPKKHVKTSDYFNFRG
jgi:hypothetical protein